MNKKLFIVVGIMLSISISALDKEKRPDSKNYELVKFPNTLAISPTDDVAQTGIGVASSPKQELAPPAPEQRVAAHNYSTPYVHVHGDECCKRFCICLAIVVGMPILYGIYYGVIKPHCDKC